MSSGAAALYVLVVSVGGGFSCPSSACSPRPFLLGGEGSCSDAGGVLFPLHPAPRSGHTLEAGLGATAVSLLTRHRDGAGGRADRPAGEGALLVFLLIMPLSDPGADFGAGLAGTGWPGKPALAVAGPFLPAGSAQPAYSREGIVLLMGIEHAPMVFLAVRAGLRGMPGDLVEAARAAGAGPGRITATIVLPLLRPSLWSPGARSPSSPLIGNFGVPALLGIPGRYTMLTTLIYQRTQRFRPQRPGRGGDPGIRAGAVRRRRSLGPGAAGRGARIAGGTAAAGRWRPLPGRAQALARGAGSGSFWSGSRSCHMVALGFRPR